MRPVRGIPWGRRVLVSAGQAAIRGIKVTGLGLLYEALASNGWPRAMKVGMYYQGYWNGSHGEMGHDHHWDRDHQRRDYNEYHDNDPS